MCQGIKLAASFAAFCAYSFAVFAWNYFFHAKTAKIKTRKKRKEKTAEWKCANVEMYKSANA
ncbi:MAG: hypothetical protein EA394_10990 [Bacteroidia bacterium]|nr:MAG: hypothetical protein EA394_10990 [Bacteroidia bacterium]